MTWQLHSPTSTQLHISLLGLQLDIHAFHPALGPAEQLRLGLAHVTYSIQGSAAAHVTKREALPPGIEGLASWTTWGYPYKMIAKCSLVITLAVG